MLYKRAAGCTRTKWNNLFDENIIDGDKPHSQEGEYAGNVVADCKIITAKPG